MSRHPAELVEVLGLKWDGNTGKRAGFVYEIAEPDRTIGWRVWCKLMEPGSKMISTGSVIVTMKAKDREAAVAAAETDHRRRILSSIRCRHD